MRTRTALIAVGMGTAVSLAGAGVAAADPPRGDFFPVVCDNGVTYQVVGTGNGAFTPVHDLSSTSMLVPTRFGEFHFTLTDSSGNVIEEETEPPTTKGSSSRQRKTTVSCTFTISDTFEDPSLGLLTFTVEGSVSGFVTPVR